MTTLTGLREDGRGGLEVTTLATRGRRRNIRRERVLCCDHTGD